MTLLGKRRQDVSVDSVKKPKLDQQPNELSLLNLRGLLTTTDDILLARFDVLSCALLLSPPPRRAVRDRRHAL